MSAAAPPDTSPPKLRVYCVEDHSLVRLGLATLINATPDLEFCGESVTCAHARHEIPRVNPDLALIDISLSDGSGLDLIKELQRSHPKLRTCAFSVHDELVYAPRALRAGASGYLMKSEPPEQILSTIRRIAAGGKVVSEGVLATLFSPTAGATPLQRDLTDRELEIIELYGDGATTAEIAARLGTTEKAVAAHRFNLSRKLRLNTGGEFIHYCVEWCRNRQALGGSPKRSGE